MTRNGKIARLPKAIRDQLNKNLEDGQKGVWQVEWLNSLPEVQQVLKDLFDGRPINEVNLTEWKGGGFQEWQARQDMQAHALELVEEAQDLKSALPGVLAEHLNIIVAGRFAELLNKWNGEVDEGFVKKLKALRMLSHEVTVQRRGELAAGHQALRVERLALDREKFAAQDLANGEKALRYCVKESEQWPEVKDELQRVFRLRWEYVEGKRRNREYEQRQRVKAAAELKCRQAQEERRVHTARAEGAEKRRQWMEAHPGEHPDVSSACRDWKIDESKRLKDPTLMPAEALVCNGPIDWSLVDWPTSDGSSRVIEDHGGRAE